MRTIVPCLACIVLCAPLIAQTPAADEAAVRAIVQKYMDARDLADAHALEALFTADADQLVSSGEWRRGRAELVKGTLASSQSTGGKRTIAVTSVRFPAPGVAIADGHYDLTGLTGGQTRNMWTTLILTRSGAGWRIAAIRNMLPAAPAPAK
jgi:uncharacterized protein (TIGR02246 family)